MYERASMLRYTYIACLVLYCHGVLISIIFPHTIYMHVETKVMSLNIIVSSTYYDG